MKLFGWVLFLGLAIGLPVIAQADSVTIYTPPVTVEGREVVSCNIVNVSDQARTVWITPHLGDTDPGIVLPPGQVQSNLLGGGPGCTNGGCPVYCAFKVTGGSITSAPPSAWRGRLLPGTTFMPS